MTEPTQDVFSVRRRRDFVRVSFSPPQAKKMWSVFQPAAGDFFLVFFSPPQAKKNCIGYSEPNLISKIFTLL